MKENSIEEITFVENEIKNTKRLFEEVGCYAFFDEDLCKAIEYILSDYKKVLKENEELEEINNELEAEKNETIRRYNFETITIKKIKDKIEVYKNILKICNKAKDIDRIKAINERILELQELIEKEK